MVTIETPRLILVSTPLGIIDQRLARDEFQADVPLQHIQDPNVSTETIHVRFPPEWPGDALGLFPGWKSKMESGQDYDILFTMIERSERVAIGGISLFKVPPAGNNIVQIGYGVNLSYERRGYATEAATGLVQWAALQPNISQITATCLETNIGSIRVLEKSGFIRAGTRLDDEGPMIVWDYPRSM